MWGHDQFSVTFLICFKSLEGILFFAFVLGMIWGTASHGTPMENEATDEVA